MSYYPAQSTWHSKLSARTIGLTPSGGPVVRSCALAIGDAGLIIAKCPMFHMSRRRKLGVPARMPIRAGGTIGELLVDRDPDPSVGAMPPPTRTPSKECISCERVRAWGYRIPSHLKTVPRQHSAHSGCVATALEYGRD